MYQLAKFNAKIFSQFLLRALIKFVTIDSLAKIILTITLCAIIFNHYIPHNVKAIIFTLSSFLKEVLMFCLPVLIFPLIVNSIIRAPSNKFHIIIILFISVFISNFFSVMIAYVSSYSILHYLPLINNIKFYQEAESIHSIINFNLHYIDISTISILAIISGLIIHYVPNVKILNILKNYYQLSDMILKKFLIIFLPIYTAGSMLKVSHEINFGLLIPIIGTVILIILIIQSIYIFLLFLISTNWNIFKSISLIKESIPAWLLGFSTMSSLITLPTTLKIIEKSTNDCHVAKLVITTTVNFHDIGDCISLPLIALTIMYFLSGYVPPVSSYLVFAIFAALNQFSAISVPGGSIVIMLPLLVKYLGFTEEMSSLMIAISFCLESLGTSMNVMGNIAFSMIMSKLFKHSN